MRKFFSRTAGILFLLLLHTGVSARTERPVSPDGTRCYARKDGQELKLDYYLPEPSGDTVKRPAILFMFGGGFVAGTRDDATYLPWFRKLKEEGYTVVSIDYRLPLKDAKARGLNRLKAFLDAIQTGVDDLYSATAWLIAHGQEIGVDASRLVICGSSAGAIIVDEAEWELASRAPAAAVLPEGFRYRGVISFSGAILSRKGKLKYGRSPAPMLLMHGTDDKVVNYGKIRVLNWGFYGSKAIAKTCGKNGYVHHIIRYTGHGHDIANLMFETFPEQRRFLEDNIIRGIARTVDATVDDPSVPKKKSYKNRKELYAD